ncbi:MAG: zinc transport system ATP-binding protein [Thermoplasmata archaeon]|jgi:energy-coupling factor transporter ATP-binding protein EcfA2|nr:zinc transport system ATP-binding protein [Thermoplasmata archaeon]
MDEPLAQALGVPAATGAGTVDLEARAGEVVLLRGGNGAGKTSLLRRLAGLDAPVRPRQVKVAAGRLAFAPQHARDGLVGLTIAGEFRLRRQPAPTALGLDAGRPVAELSAGEARRVLLATVVGANPRLLLLDEPAEGLDRARMELLRATVRGVAAAGGAVVAVDHTGCLADLATRTLDLGSLPAPPARPLPRPTGPPVVGRWGPGLHLVAGPNGSGKSTLLARTAKDPAARWLPSDARLLLSQPTVADELHGADPAVAGLLVPPALRTRHPLTLSGGEAQRVALASTLGRPARAYLLDEPEAYLDAAGRGALLTALAARLDAAAAVVVASHEPMWEPLAQDRLDLEAPTA